MATLYYTIGQAGKNGQQSSANALKAPFRVSGTHTTSASATNIDTGQIYTGEVITLRPVGGAVMVNFGAAASATAGMYFPDGEARPLELMAGNDSLQISVIDA